MLRFATSAVPRRSTVALQRRAVSLEQYNEQIRAQVGTGSDDSVIALLTSMSNQGVQPNVETFKAVLSFYREDWKKNGKAREAKSTRENQAIIAKLVGEVVEQHEEENGALEQEEKNNKWWEE